MTPFRVFFVIWQTSLDEPLTKIFYPVLASTVPFRRRDNPPIFDGRLAVYVVYFTPIAFAWDAPIRRQHSRRFVIFYNEVSGNASMYTLDYSDAGVATISYPPNC